MLWETAYAEFVFTDTLWPDFGSRRPAGGARRVRRPRPAVRRPMSAFWSRIVVALVLLPLVLGIVWLGGWWLFAVALVGGLIALHELYAMGRGLRPIVLGGYVGLLLTLLGAELGGDLRGWSAASSRPCSSPSSSSASPTRARRRRRRSR